MKKKGAKIEVTLNEKIMIKFARWKMHRSYKWSSNNYILQEAYKKGIYEEQEEERRHEGDI